MGMGMGMFAERRSHQQWHFIGSMKKNVFYEHEIPYCPEPLYVSENESLFAMLADVKNGLADLPLRIPAKQQVKYQASSK